MVLPCRVYIEDDIPSLIDVFPRCADITYYIYTALSMRPNAGQWGSLFSEISTATWFNHSTYSFQLSRRIMRYAIVNDVLSREIILYIDDTTWRPIPEERQCQCSGTPSEPPIRGPLVDLVSRA